MSWIPSFLNPFTAAIAAAIVIPSLLLLYFLKLRRREVDVASTILWKKSIQDLQVNAPFQKLRKNLLLLLQLLLLALLLLALSRPITHYTPGAGRSSVILIDRSASMSAKDVEGRSRLDEAKKQAKELVDTLDRNGTAMVIAFDDEARPVQKFTSDRNQLKRAIDSIEPSDRPTRLKLAYQLAEAQVAFIPEQNRTNVEPPEVWVYSDGRVADSAELQIRAPVKYVMIGGENTGNIGVVALSARRNYDRPNEVQIFARLANFGPQPTSAQVQLSIAPLDATTAAADDAFAVSRVAEVFLPPERWTEQERSDAEKNQNFVARDSVEFTVELTTAAVVRVEQMKKDGDALAADDAAAVVVPPPKALTVLLVTEGNYYLERAIDSLRLQKPQQMTPAEYDAKVPGDFDVIIFDRHSPAKLPPGGNFIYFGGIAPGLRVTADAPADMSQSLSAAIEDMTVLDWRRDHPILKNLNLGKVYAATAMKLNVPVDVTTLVDGVKGPMVVLHREGRGTHLVVGFDVLQSNWPLRVSFPVFLHQALQFMAIGADLNVRESFKPGAAVTIPRANLVRAEGGVEPKQLRLIGPGGTSRTIDVPPAGDFALPAMERVGVYRTEPVVPQFERVAVNLTDPAESNTLPTKTVPGGSGEAIAAADQKSRLELWWWIVACVALPLLLIEWWVYTRRVHL
jgi:hypothetical protein